jgi:riboflavin biosynthesis pyrimidine reductase
MLRSRRRSSGDRLPTAQALAAGLVDEVALFVWPVILGGRNPALPTDTHIHLELIDEHRFDNSVVYLRYRLQ